jgi:hypothetical protein
MFVNILEKISLKLLDHGVLEKPCVYLVMMNVTSAQYRVLDDRRTVDNEAERMRKMK